MKFTGTMELDFCLYPDSCLTLQNSISDHRNHESTLMRSKCRDIKFFQITGQ